jgi:hypothetical protein
VKFNIKALKRAPPVADGKFDPIKGGLESLPLGWVWVIPISPFGSEEMVLALDQDLSLFAGQTRLIGSIDCNLDGLSLAFVGAIVLV